MCLRFAFLLITRVIAWLRLSRREDAWKTAEIMILRHQLAVLQRHQPRRRKLNWADRALLAALLAALLGVTPKARRRGLRLLVTPDTIVRWHRDPADEHRGRSRRPARGGRRRPQNGHRAAARSPQEPACPPSRTDPGPPGPIDRTPDAQHWGKAGRYHAPFSA